MAQCSTASCRGWALPAASCRSNVCSDRSGSNADGRSWRRCASRPGPANRPRSITVSSGSGSARSRRRSICSCSRSAIRVGCMPHAYRHERLTSLLDGDERAFRWFGGVTLSCLTITRAIWCWAAASIRCCGIRSGVTPFRWTVKGCGNQCFDESVSRSRWASDSRWRNGGDEGCTILR